MSRTITKYLRLPVCVLAMLVSLEAATILPGINKSEPACVRIDAWLSKSGHLVPSTIDEMLQYPAEYRARMFARLSPAAQSKAWSQYWQIHESETASFTPEQTTLFARIKALMAAGQIMGNHSDEVNALSREVLTTFPRESILTLFSIPDTSAAMPTTMQALSVRLRENIRSFATTVSASDCTCELDIWCQWVLGDYSACCYNSPYLWCQPTTSGCGVFGGEACTGNCHDANWCT